MDNSSSSSWQSSSAISNCVDEGEGGRNETMPPKASIPNHIKILSPPGAPGLFKCEKKLTTRSQLVYDKKQCILSDARKPHKCVKCGRGFLDKWHLSYHLRTHSGERPFPCETCGKRFLQRGHLKAHSRTHSGEKPFHCQKCGTGFWTKSHLQRHHIVACHDERVFLPCSKRENKRKDALKSHMKSHSVKSNERAAYSPRDGSSSSRKSTDSSRSLPGPAVDSSSSLAMEDVSPGCNGCNDLKGNRDLSIIVAKKAFSCDQCEKSFTWKGSLQRHIIQRHTGVKSTPFFCEKCQRGFATLDGLARHLRNPAIHPPQGQNTIWLMCTACDIRINGLSSMKEHERKHHKKEVIIKHVCHRCGMGFMKLSVLHLHERSHSEDLPFGCRFCKSRFTRRNYVVRHMKRVHKILSDNILELEASRQNCLEEGKGSVEDVFLPELSEDPRPSTSKDVQVHHDHVQGGSESNGISSSERLVFVIKLSGSNAQNGVILEKKACLLPPCPPLPPPISSSNLEFRREELPDSIEDDVECGGRSPPSQRGVSLSLNDASSSLILTTCSSTPSPVVVPRPSSPLPGSSSNVENNGRMIGIGSGSEARIEDCAEAFGKAAETEQNLEGDIFVFMDESGVDHFETVEAENSEDDDSEANGSLNAESNSNSTTSPPTPAPSTTSSSPVACSSSSLGSGGSIIADKDRVEIVSLCDKSDGAGTSENQNNLDQQAVVDIDDVAEAEGVPVEIVAEAPDENLEESDDDDDDDIYNPDDFFDDDNNSAPPELNQAPDDEPVLTHTHHHHG